ncbi:Uncharacterized protein ABC855_g285 [[Candida] zeylanoides]
MGSLDDQRFHLFPRDRLKVVATLGAAVGGFQGFYEGTRLAALRYLTENSHRLPTRVGGWYFYHKKKNYVMIISGLRQSVLQACRTSAAVAAFFGAEMAVDRVRGTVDFANTTAAAVASGAVLAAYNGLGRVQVLKYMQRGGALGLSLGITQDLLIWTRGGRVWYLDQLGVKNPRYAGAGTGAEGAPL